MTSINLQEVPFRRKDLSFVWLKFFEPCATTFTVFRS